MKISEEVKRLFKQNQSPLQYFCEYFVSTDKKKILCDISGEFKQFELSAIIGQSGSGKTSLLNILSTYDHLHHDGAIQIDGMLASPKIIQKNSSYIMQEYNFHSFLTVRESMEFTVNCKFYSRSVLNKSSNKVSKRKKNEKCVRQNLF